MTKSLTGLTVFLVEDDFLILLDLQTVLEDAGAKVITATTVRDAIARSDDKYHAAVLDIRLPDGEVYPVAERLSKSRIPIVFHSGNTETSALQSRFPGALALPKPAGQETLISAIKQHARSA